MYKNFTLTKLAEGIYAAISREGGKAVSNAGIIDTGSDTIVFDAFLSMEAAEELKNAAEAVTGRKAAYVVNSHYHIDHTGGNAVFAKDVAIISGETTRELAESKNSEMLAYYRENSTGILEHFSSMLEKAVSTEEKQQLSEQLVYAQTLTDNAFELVYPGITFDGRLALYGSINSIELVNFTDGHTECDTVLYVRGKGILFSGDMVFVGRHPWLGAGDPHNLQKHLARLETWKISTLVPGHGGLGTFEDIALMGRYVEAVDSIAQDIAAGTRTLKGLDSSQLPHPFNVWKGDKFLPNIRFFVEKVYSGKLV